MPQVTHPSMKTKMFINDAPQSVNEANLGLCMCNSNLVKMEGHRIVYRRDHHSTLKSKVKLLSGGGGGHYPTQAGFVGPGMLTAAVSGEVFRAPSSSTILLAIKEIGVGHPEGVLLIVSNYVGDRINFGLAMERAHLENIKVRMLVVGDDCAVQNPPEPVGRRGIAGVVFVIKVAGAMAEEGRKLEDIYNACRSPCFNEMSTIGFAMTSPNVPGAFQSCRVPDEDIAFGVGVHGNEIGIRALPATYNAGEIVTRLLDRMAVTTKSLSTEDSVAVLINNLGGACLLEEQIFSMETIKQLTARGVRIRRVFVGRCNTSLDTCGMSITVLGLNAPIDIVKYLDAETKVPGWPKLLTAKHVGVITDDEYDLPIVYQGRQFPEIEALHDKDQGPLLTTRNADSLHQIIRIAAEALMASTSTLDNTLSDLGDRGCSINVRKGAEEILHALNSHEINVKRPYATLQNLSTLCGQSMAGTSGLVYSIFFAVGSNVFLKLPEDAKINVDTWITAMRDGINAIKKYGMARKGDRTMLDPLIAAEAAGRVAVEAGEKDGRMIGEAMASAAENAASETVLMPAYVERTGYAFQQSPDPGAVMVAVWLRGISDALRMVF